MKHRTATRKLLKSGKRHVTMRSTSLGDDIFLRSDQQRPRKKVKGFFFSGRRFAKKAPALGTIMQAAHRAWSVAEVEEMIIT
jgi:hypothetical protein